jgi:hypothetical protein
MQADFAEGMTALQHPRATLAVVVVFQANAATGWLHRHDWRMIVREFFVGDFR